jgi:anti-sigma regulatory factor (Ser/Thr protein kinase)
LSQDERNEHNNSPHASTIDLPASLDAPALARLHLRQFRPQLAPAVLDDALILTSELVTNAVLHGKPEISLSVRIEMPNLIIAVSDESSMMPPEKPELPLLAAPHGRGLAIVDTLAAEWGISRHTPGPGKDVWFLLPLN